MIPNNNLENDIDFEYFGKYFVSEMWSEEEEELKSLFESGEDFFVSGGTTQGKSYMTIARHKDKIEISMSYQPVSFKEIVAFYEKANNVKYTEEQLLAAFPLVSYFVETYCKVKYQNINFFEFYFEEWGDFEFTVTEKTPDDFDALKKLIVKLEDIARNSVETLELAVEDCFNYNNPIV